MRFTIKLSLEDDNGVETLEEIIQFDKNCDNNNTVGISLDESRQLLKTLQTKVVLQQSKEHIESKKICSCCNKKQNIKGYHSIVKIPT